MKEEEMGYQPVSISLKTDKNQQSYVSLKIKKKKVKNYNLHVVRRILGRFVEVQLKEINPDESQPIIGNDDDDDDEIEGLKDGKARSIVLRVGDCYLKIRTQLAKQLEEQYYCKDEKDDNFEEGEEGERFDFCD
ncbi:hypothetical protein BY996DRAFT_6523575 [Phakopsora pachyrhizi]|nr:hypothetical protein BY996DRAFT_6523575 [Phakopsora pachyrhizi]